MLKFVGDAALAVFLSLWGTRRGRAAPPSAPRAEVFARAETANAAREGREPIVFGSAIHVGEVMYGNIGGPIRLDFTVIGPALIASRIPGKGCCALERPLPASEAFVSATGKPARTSGSKGVATEGTPSASPERDRPGRRAEHAARLRVGW